MGLLQVPGARGDRCGLRALRRAGAAAAEGGQAGGQRLVDLRRGQEVHVGVEAAGGEDLALARDRIGARADDQVGVDTVGDVGVSAAADADDPPVLDPDVGADDAPVVQDHHVGDHRVQGSVGRAGQRLVHRLADRLASAEHRFLAAEGEVLLDLDPQVGVPEPDLVTGGRPEDRGIVLAADLHDSGLRGLVSPDLQAGYDPASAQGDDIDAARGARLEAHRGTGRDVETETLSRFPIELQAGVHVGQVDVRADLDRPVRGVGDGQLGRAPPDPDRH